MDYQRLWEDFRGQIRAQQVQEEAAPTWEGQPDCVLLADDYLEMMDELEGAQRGEEYRLVGGVYQREVS